MPSNISGSKRHIKYILENVSAQYSNQTNKLINDTIIKYANEKYPKIEDLKCYNDDKNDIHCKFSIYRICEYNKKYYMIEGALGVNISFLSYDFRPLAYIKKYLQQEWNNIQYLTKVKKSIIMQKKLKNKNINKKVQDSDDIINVIGNIDSINVSDPVLCVTGYSTVFKEIDNINNKNFIQRDDFNQNLSSYDIYLKKIEDDKYVFMYPYVDDVYQLNTLQFNELRRFERDRLKHGS